MVNKSLKAEIRTAEKLKISSFSRIKDKLRHGLIFQSVRSLLSKAGLDIFLYYWVKEGVYDLSEPPVKGDPEKIKISFLSEEDMIEVEKNSRGYIADELISWMRKGKKCLGLKYDDSIVAFMWIDFNECTFDPAKTTLREDECYLSDMYTVEKYRGRNLATYLRYRSYKILNEMGKTRIYSVSEYFNKSARRYKEKLKAVNLKLVLYFRLFKKIRGSFKIKSYEKKYASI